MHLSIAYAPPIQYFTKLIASPVSIEAAEYFIKQTYRNRTRILSSNGFCDLTIPLEKGANSQCLIRDVRISDHDNWRAKHWQAIQTSYGLAPFFEYYAYELEPFYKEQYTYLFDFNMAYLCRLLELLHLSVDISFTQNYEKEVEEDFRNKIIPKKNFLDSLFNPIPYYQNFLSQKEFIPNLSILDLLFNMGPESILILQKSSSKIEVV